MNTWSFDGVDLSTFGVITLFDDYLDLPDKRGNNQVIPFRNGARFVEKYYDERTLQMGMTITAATPALLETALGNLRALLSQRTEQVLSQTLADTTIRTVLASVNKKLQINRPTPWTAKLVIEFDLSYPFFRLSTEIASNETTINASPKAMVVTNPGTAPEYDATFVLTGPLSNTVITNSTNGMTLTYTGTIASPRVVTISVNTTTKEFVATDDLGADKIANISHSGASALMVFEVGTNNLSITDGTATTGKVRVRFFAPFL